MLAMSESDTFPCPSCGTTYRRGSLSQGQRVKCRNCGAIITVPGDEFEALEELIEAPEESAAPARRSKGARGGRGASSPRSKARSGGGSRASSTRGGGARGRGAARQAPEKKSPTMLFVGIGAALLLGVGGWFLSQGGGDKNGDGSSGKTAKNSQASSGSGSNGSASSGGSKSDAPKKAATKKPTKRERFDAAVKAAEASTDKAAKVAKFLEAIDLRDGIDVSVDDLRKKILEADPEHRDTRIALGFVQYTGKHPEWKDKWVTRDKYAEIQREWQRLEKERAAELAKKAESERWSSAFGKKAKRVADYFRKDVSIVPDLSLKFFFDTKDIPKPYLLMVEDAQTPDPAVTASIIGPGLAALRTQFRKAYPGKILPNWDDQENVVPVMIFKDEKSYERYRGKHPEKKFPSTDVVAAFYVSAVHRSVEDICKGALYVWPNSQQSDYEFNHSLFHEGTHQIMHNAATGFGGRPMMPRTPWLGEGIAEFWGSYEGNRYAGYKFRRLLEGRMPVVQNCAIAYQRWRGLHRKWVEGGKQGDAPAQTGFMTPKNFLSVSRLRFDQARRRRGDKRATADDEFIVSSAYALGWAWIYYCHVGVRASKVGKSKREFIRGWENVLADELRHKFSMKRLEEHYGIASQEEWDAITKDFFFFCQRTLRKYVSGAIDVPDVPFPK